MTPPSAAAAASAPAPTSHDRAPVHTSRTTARGDTHHESGGPNPAAPTHLSQLASTTNNHHGRATHHADSPKPAAPTHLSQLAPTTKRFQVGAMTATAPNHEAAEPVPTNHNQRPMPNNATQHRGGASRLQVYPSRPVS